jgi:hypothetical protein
MSILDNMPHTCRHQREAHSNDQYMGRTAAATTIATGLECFVQNASFTEIAEFQKIGQRITHKVFWRLYSEKRPGDLLNSFAMANGSTNNGLPGELKVRATTDRTVFREFAYCSFCEEEANEPPASFT